MRMHTRTARVILWSGLGVCVLIAVLWAVSNDEPVVCGRSSSRFWDERNHGLLIGDGTWVVIWHGQVEYIRWGGPFFVFLEPSTWGLPSIGRTPLQAAIQMPLWAISAIVLIPTILAWRSLRRRPRPGYCICGYDLTGNVSGVCPECGE